MTSSPTLVSQSRGFHRKGRFQGWRFGVMCCTSAAFAVLLLDSILAIVAHIALPRHKGISTIYEGSCTVVNTWSVFIHAVINILSPLLLGASNYTMQCLAAPTRNDLDRAHAKGIWLDVGVPSIRNLALRIRWERILLWWLLAMSSLPIHLFYNSAVFKTLSATDYDVVLATSAFLEGKSFRADFDNFVKNDELYFEPPMDTSALYSKISSFQSLRPGQDNIIKLDKSECIKAYGKDITTDRGPLLLITSDISAANSGDFVLWQRVEGSNAGFSSLSYDWMCFWLGLSKPCSPASLSKAADWEIALVDSTRYPQYTHLDGYRTSYKIDYCLTTTVAQPGTCQLQLSLEMLLTVIFYGLLKTMAIARCLKSNSDPTLTTIGDAIACFLDSPDSSFQHHISQPDWRSQRASTRWHYRCWAAGAETSRWLTTLVLCLAGLGASIVGLSAGAHATNTKATLYGQSGQSFAFSRGFGTLDVSSMVEIFNIPAGTRGLIVAVLIANAPQVIFSILYLLYNGMATAMVLASEWSSYYLRKKTLRVTDPRGSQRSTYFLSLPYRYGVPLLLASIVLHWLMSQSIFLVRIKRLRYDIHGNFWNTEDGTVSSLGCSCPPMLAAVLVGSAMLGGLISIGCRKLEDQCL